MLDRELQHSTSHSPTSLLEKNGKKERENLCFVPGINRKEIHGRFLFRKIMPKQSGTWWSFCFLPPPKQQRRKESDCALWIRDRVGIAQLGGISKGKETNPNNLGKWPMYQSDIQNSAPESLRVGWFFLQVASQMRRSCPNPLEKIPKRKTAGNIQL